MQLRCIVAGIAKAFIPAAASIAPHRVNEPNMTDQYQRPTAPNKRERRVLDLLVGGSALPSSEFYRVGIETLAQMAGKGWISYSRQPHLDRLVYSITDHGIAARQVEPAGKRRSLP